jgi:hypothetical protein
MLNVIMLNVIMLNVVMMSVLGPIKKYIDEESKKREK